MIGVASAIVALSILSISSQALAYVRYGSSGATVTTIQSTLRNLGYGVGVDGVFGPQTENAVIAFQRSRGLLADGIVGLQPLAQWALPYPAVAAAGWRRSSNRLRPSLNQWESFEHSLRSWCRL
uniref:Peptidoglycan-binding domain-containing protein n=1 Tax=Desertifilum tharense IPPAS B-1220 TaxID=1781255 RepID=A0ACD5GV98_9CYAN